MSALRTAAGVLADLVEQHGFKEPPKTEVLPEAAEAPKEKKDNVGEAALGSAKEEPGGSTDKVKPAEKKEEEETHPDKGPLECRDSAKEGYR